LPGQIAIANMNASGMTTLIMDVPIFFTVLSIVRYYFFEHKDLYVTLYQMHKPFL